jgi:CubicO group peptidase (beta-lactamase class C family)
MKKLLKRILWLIIIAIIVFAFIYAWPRLPIITAFAAKGMCSSVFVAGKDPERVMAEDLSFFPISLARAKVNYKEQSVTATVFGLARRKAVFREGLGSVIVLDVPEDELRAASFKIPDPGYSQDTIPWPKGDVLPGSLPQGVNYMKLEAIMGEAFDPPDAKPLKKTLGVAIVYDGQLIAEKYLEGYDQNTKFHGWSMAKSLIGSVVGILTGDGIMDVNAKVDIPEWKNDERGNTTLGNLLQMNSGLDWVENYFTISEATVMLMQSSDMYQYTVGRPSEYAPGSHWRYCSGDANLVSGLIRRAVGNDEQYHRLPYTRLMHRIGMLNTLIETDAAGNFVASSYSYGTVRDWARLGLLYMNNVVFAGDTILPPGWTDYVRQEAPDSKGVYGATFWLKELNPLNDLKDAPGDIFFADGFLGQRVYIIPSKKLIVVRMGYSLKNFNLNDFLSDIISALPA